VHGEYLGPAGSCCNAREAAFRFGGDLVDEDGDPAAEARTLFRKPAPRTSPPEDNGPGVGRRNLGISHAS
jgi:hypothetical protein